MLRQTIDRLCELRLHGMAQALQEQLELGIPADLSFDERFSLVVEREWMRRKDRKTTRRLRAAELKIPTARVEDIDYRHPRGLDRAVFQNLTTVQWVGARRNLVMTGATGLGKTWLICALGDRACRDGFTVFYRRVARLIEELSVARADGSYLRVLAQLARTDLLILDDWGLSPIEGQAQHDLLEVVDDRIGLRSTIVTSQLPVGQWHDLMADATVADALLDRLLQSSVLIPMKGKSMRKRSDHQMETDEPPSN